MFSGIIEEVGTLSGIESRGGARRLSISTSFAPELTVGQSVAVNGVCQTVVESGETAFAALAIQETLRKTTLGYLEAGCPVNLERAVRPTDRLDGHLVQGHVDTTGTVTGLDVEGVDLLVRIAFDPSWAHYLIPVGSVAVDGISLTVARLESSELTVALIPHTLAHTNCATWLAGTPVNLEFDAIGKFVARRLETWQAMYGRKPDS